MQYLFIAVTMFISVIAFGQIEQNVNKTSGTELNPIAEIDSIRFNNGQMEIILNNGALETHALEDINNVTFSGDLNLWPSGTVNCDGATEVVDVTNPITGATWMDRNLGALQAATSSTDHNAYGDLYQWGRSADGHQCRTSSTTSALSSSDQLGHADFILAPNSPNDWRNPQNTNLWQGVSGVNNPCPIGYRVPTISELEAERLSWSTNNSNGAATSVLKLPMSGFRRRNDGSFINVDQTGCYWSSTVIVTHSHFLFFSGGFAMEDEARRADGMSVRCIKN